MDRDKTNVKTSNEKVALEKWIDGRIEMESYGYSKILFRFIIKLQIIFKSYFGNDG